MSEVITVDRAIELPQLRDSVYLDNAGAGLPLKSHLDSYTRDLTTNLYGNPHSLHSASWLTDKVISSVRDEIAQFLNTDLTHYTVLFTSGTTHACRLLAEAFCWGQGQEQEQGHVYLSSDLREYKERCEAVQQAVLAKQSCCLYLETSHTSVVGMRELARERGALSVCVREEDLFGSVPPNLVPCPFVQGDSTAIYPHSSVPKLFKGVTTAEEASDTFLRLSRDRLSREDSIRREGLHLLTYPATCNFSGRRYSLGALEQTARTGLKLGDVTFPPNSVKVFIDAAAALSTSEIDLSRDSPHFLAVSFYKLFGFPTGIGALLVRSDSCCLLDKRYFGGGTVWNYLSRHSFHLRKDTQKFFEEGTISYQGIFALNHGFQALRSLGLSMRGIASHTFSLTEYTHGKLSSLRHYNGAQLCEIYTRSPLLAETQGPIISFNVMRSNGSYVGYSTLRTLANSNSIFLRVGSFCNIGACQRYLKLSDEVMLRFLEAGHTCGDKIDLVNGVPTGAVRVSFGFYNTIGDADRLISMLERNFIENKAPVSVAVDTSAVASNECIRVREICVYPIKSCGCFKVDKWPVCEKGFIYDRVWVIKDSRNVLLKPIIDRNLFRIKPSIDLESGIMQIGYPGMDPISFNISDNVEQTQLSKIRVYGVRLQAASSPKEVNDWLSRALGYPVELVKQFSERFAVDKPKYVKVDRIPMQLQGKTHVLMLTEQSADRVIKLAAGFADSSYSESVGELIDRMRGNIIVAGQGLEPFAEHKWKRVSINDVSMDYVCDCERCEVINIHPADLSVSEVPMRFLSKERRNLFGILLSFDIQPGKQLMVSVGDTLVVNHSEE